MSGKQLILIPIVLFTSIYTIKLFGLSERKTIITTRNGS
jgi:hypothetical protein